MAAIRLLDVASVLTCTGLKRRTFYCLRERGDFPEPVRLSTNPHDVVWPSDVIEARVLAHRGETVFADRVRAEIVSTE